MNEVSKIHLGRQAFTISVEAQRELRSYLNAIEKQVDDPGVIQEVELRMAELLAEHGVGGDKVVLANDVSFLKEQLGDPKDFRDTDDDDQTADDGRPGDTKRLFRDTDNAMLAGVASGLAAYSGLDVLLIRILFIIATFAGLWGIVVYLLLWILVPEAKTSSDRLQMAGKPVTIKGLKDVVERADIEGAARRANKAISGPVNSFFRFVLKVIGVAFTVFGLSTLLALVAGTIYYLLNNGTLLQNNLFPVGFREHLLLDMGVVFASLVAVFIVIFGVAIFRRKWPLRAWITGVLVGIAFISLAAGGALAADTVPAVRDRYNANVFTTSRSLKPFNSVTIYGNDDEAINFVTSSTYSVAFNYYGHPNLNSIKTAVVNGVLTVDAQQYDNNRRCQGLCIPDTYNMNITIYSPNADQLSNQWNGPSAPDAPMPEAVPAPVAQ